MKMYQLIGHVLDGNGQMSEEELLRYFSGREPDEVKNGIKMLYDNGAVRLLEDGRYEFVDW